MPNFYGSSDVLFCSVRTYLLKGDFIHYANKNIIPMFMGRVGTYPVWIPFCRGAKWSGQPVSHRQPHRSVWDPDSGAPPPLSFAHIPVFPRKTVELQERQNKIKLEKDIHLECTWDSITLCYQYQECIKWFLINVVHFLFLRYQVMCAISQVN